MKSYLKDKKRLDALVTFSLFQYRYLLNHGYLDDFFVVDLEEGVAFFAGHVPKAENCVYVSADEDYDLMDLEMDLEWLIEKKKGLK